MGEGRAGRLGKRRLPGQMHGGAGQFSLLEWTKGNKLEDISPGCARPGKIAGSW